MREGREPASRCQDSRAQPPRRQAPARGATGKWRPRLDAQAGTHLRLGHTEALSESAVLSAPPPGLPPAAAVIGGAGQKRQVCSMAA